MLIPLSDLVQKYKLNIKGILHVGAHECEELSEYQKYMNPNNILWIEALPDKVELNKNKYPYILIENAIVSDKVENITFNRSNNDQSSSIFELGTHKEMHPTIHYTQQIHSQSTTLNNILEKYPNFNFNLVNLDIQGAELKALKGLNNHLHHVDYIYTEVNSDYVYKDCGLIEEIDEYLSKYNFHRVETEWFHTCTWGDAFYIKK